MKYNQNNGELTARNDRFAYDIGDLQISKDRKGKPRERDFKIIWRPRLGAPNVKEVFFLVDGQVRFSRYELDEVVDFARGYAGREVEIKEVPAGTFIGRKG